MKKLGHSFGSGSGMSSRSCYFLAYRFVEEHGFRPESAESWIMEGRDGKFHTGLTQRGWMTSLWCSTEGRVFVSEANGRVFEFVKPAPGPTDYKVHELPGMLTGVWGLADDCVWVWGLHAGAPVLYHWNGETWRAEAAPGSIVAMHGARRDLCVAVGEGGMIALWNGRTWSRMESPSTMTLSDVFMVSEDDIVACGSRGDILTGTIYGWRRVLTHDGGLVGVAKWNGDTWVGAGAPLGVAKLVDGALVSVKPAFLGARFDARGELLAASREFVGSTSDGVKYKGYPIAPFAALIADVPPSW
jgi:hypothetical protein